MNKREPDDRIERALEGLLSDEELAAFQADVIRDPDLRAAYVDRAWLHASLRAQRETLPELLQTAATEKVVRRWPVILWTSALAACVTLAATIAGVAYVRRPVATLVQAENCQWAGSDLPTVVNAKLGRGTLALVQGIATLRFQNGATIMMEAPTTLEIHDAMHCRLVEGSVVAEVPEPAHGFTINTADMKVVDLGTKFGLAAARTGNSQVRVFKGEVEVGGVRDGKMQRLLEGKGMHIGAAPVASGAEPTRGQQVQETTGWTSIPTSFGAGKDGFARRGKGAALGAEPLIMVKHSELPGSRNNERRAILTFDVSHTPTAKVTEAQIALEPEASGFGFSTMVPDSRFAVYGLTDEALDAWDEKAMRWESLPGSTDDALDPNVTRKLAEFWIPRGGAGGSIIVRGDALADFIRQDTNGLVSFLIVRETGETDPSGLVHAFASKEHPSARPPTLRLK
jgi:ferric-dicitrate binding protein FerR (iron transport regulator)